MHTDWKVSLSITQRYETIQSLQATIPGGSMVEAISLENQAYDTASSMQEYIEACKPAAVPPPSQLIPAGPSSPPYTPTPEPQKIEDGPGVRIGDFLKCQHIASGVTSDVFRSGIHALKVITSVGNIEPHSPHREVKILRSLGKSPYIVQLEQTFHDEESRLVMVFPYMPLTLADLLGREPLTNPQRTGILTDTLKALHAIHSQGIIHRDIKPSAVLLHSPTGPAYLSDFGIAWDPSLSNASEPRNAKILDIGTGPYRAPEVLFGSRSYTTAIDMWSMGVLLSECVSSPATAVFESRPVQEDGNQLGLILSIFKTLGTPTEGDWPEAKDFKVTPFGMWTVFPKRRWDDILPTVDREWRDLVSGLVRFDRKRLTAAEALKAPCLAEENT